VPRPHLRDRTRRTARASAGPAAVVVLLAAGLALAACGTTPAGDGASPAPGSVTSTDAATDGDAAFPVAVETCGTDVTLDGPPLRVVTVKSSMTELVLALGLGDRLVGTAFSDGPLPADLANAPGADARVLSDRVPSHEVVLETEPDLVMAGWESVFSPDGVGDREDLAALGIGTYVAPSACREPEFQPDPLTFDDVFDGITRAGALLGAPGAAADLVAEQRAALDAVTPSAAGLSALWYSSGSDTPYVGAGIGAPQMIMEAAGLTNIAADVHDTWTSLSWEAVADRAPDVIVLVDSTWNTAAHKRQVLEENPTTAALPAVQQGRYLVVPFAATEAGVRNVEAAADLTDQLADLPAP
jgi:iron complex transport system substrate-binding protein